MSLVGASRGLSGVIVVTSVGGSGITLVGKSSTGATGIGDGTSDGTEDGGTDGTSDGVEDG